MSTRFVRILNWLEERINVTELFSLFSMFGMFHSEVDTTRPLRPAIREAFAKPLQSYSRWPRTLALLALALFVSEVLTGLLLAVYYQPTPEAAYESVLILSRDVTFGWFVRQMHYWGAQLLLLILMLRVWRFFLGRLYAPPREIVWLSGVLLLFVGFHMDFTGRLLAWTNESYWAGLRVFEIVFAAPVVGGIVEFLTGGNELGSYTLTRYYLLHVLVLPAAFFVLLYFGFATVRRVGLSRLSGEKETGARATYFSQLYSLLILSLVLLGVLVSLSLTAPSSFSAPADPLKTPVGSTLPWYMLAPYGFVEAFPPWIPLSLRSGIMALAVAAFILLPFLPLKGFRLKRISSIVFATAVLLAWLAFSYYGLLVDGASC